jgi:hypothetical protein
MKTEQGAERKKGVEPSVQDVRDRAMKLGYRLSQVTGERRWLRFDVHSGRLAGGNGMTWESVLAWLTREEAK